MSKRITIFCDLCGEEIKNPALEGHQLKTELVRFPDPYNGTENVVKIDAHDDCVRAVLNARHQHVTGKAPGKLTNLEWLCGNPDKLVEFLYCPYPGGCMHETELTLDNEDLCRPCMLDWLKEEHTDDGT